MPQKIAANDLRIKWSGNISEELSDGWVMPWRIPHEERKLYAVELTERAAMPAGVRISFQSDSSFLEISFDSTDERSHIDLLINGKLAGTAESINRTSIRFENLGSESKNLELWLPHFGEFRFGGLSIDSAAALSGPETTHAPKWITYGSSITQCKDADTPTRTWPSIVARIRGYDLTCLGFGGQCHLDPMIARVIRDREADLISLCVGINIYGGATLNQRTFAPGIMGFVKIVREKHPATPIVLLSPIYSPGREETANEVGFTLKQMRSDIVAAVEKLQANGDRNISYINGLDVFDSDHAHLLPDDLHPNNEGYGIMADNLLTLLPKV